VLNRKPVSVHEGDSFGCGNLQNVTKFEPFHYHDKGAEVLYSTV
jgi:hypothetical protein